MWSKYLFFLLVVLVATGCGGKKKLAGTKTEINTRSKNTAEGYLINNLDFRTFNGRARAKVEFGNEKQDVTLHVRIERDKTIWISVTATMFNYEAARLKITPDSVQVLNKMQSEYIAKPFTYVHKYTGPGVSFFMLQDMLMANVSQPLLRTDQITVASASNEVQIVGIKDNLSFQYSLNEKNRPKVFRMNTVGANDNLESFYSSFIVSQGYNFPQNQHIKLHAAGMNISAILNYNKAEFNQNIEIPFAIPSKYRKVE